MIDPTTFEDVLYEVRGRAAWVIINRPKLYNAFRAKTIEELIMAFKLAADDKGVSSIVLTGAGDKAFCTGGDQSAHEGQYDGRGIVGLPMDEFQSIIRDVPKPVIARVNGFAIGGGNVFATLCDLTIAADTAKFGQVGPKVGSVDGGWGTALLARHVGDKKAREIWFLNEQYTARNRRSRWASSTKWFPPPNSMKPSTPGPTSSPNAHRRRWRWPSVRSMPTARISAASARWH